MFTLLRPFIISAFALVVSTTNAVAAGAPFEMPREFRAEIQADMMGQKMVFTMIAGGEDRQRMEMTAMGTTMIMRKDQQKIYVLMTAQKQIMEMPYDPKMAQQGLGFTDDKNATWKNLGSDTVRSVACDKWEVTSGTGEIMTFWVTSDHTPVRVASKNGGVVDFLSFTAEAQDAKLFEPPTTGWTTMSGMMPPK